MSPDNEAGQGLPDGYDQVTVIGRGGSAVVYRARQVAMNRVVAVKVLHAGTPDPATLTRFERECRAAGSLSWHPNVVVVHDAGTTPAGAPYLTMEYLEGGSLAARVHAQGRLDARAVLGIGVQLADALVAAHAVGLLHRDVKPENVLLDRFGNAKLADFGIAAVQGSQDTATGMLSATLAHTPPEVLDGARATPSADLYALGSTLYTLLVGHPPFRRPGEQSQLPMMRRILEQPPPRVPAEVAPPSLGDLIDSLLAKDPGARPATAAHVVSRLQAIQASLGHPVTPHHPLVSPGSALAADEDTREVTGAPPGQTALFRRSGRAPTSEDTMSDSTPPPPRPARRRRVIWGVAVGAAVAVVLVGVGVGVAAMTGSDDTDSTGAPDPGTTSSTSSPSSPSADTGSGDSPSAPPSSSAPSADPGLDDGEQRLVSLSAEPADVADCDTWSNNLAPGVVDAVTCDLEPYFARFDRPTADAKFFVMSYDSRADLESAFAAHTIDSPTGVNCDDANYEGFIERTDADIGHLRCFTDDKVGVDVVEWTDSKHLLQLYVTGPVGSLEDLYKIGYFNLYTYNTP